MIKAVLVVISLSLAWPQLTPEVLRARIRTVGAAPALEIIYSHSDEWRQFLRGLSSGNAAWLRVGVALRRVADAGASEQIELAFGEALEHNALNVLRIAADAEHVDAVCGAPDVDDFRYNSYKGALSALETRATAVRGISDRSLRERRARCLAALNTAQGDVARFYAKR